MFPVDDLSFLFIKKLQSSALTMSPLSYPNSCTPTKSNLHLTDSLIAAVSESALYRILTFHVPNLMSHFVWVSCSRLLIQYIRIYPPFWRPFLHPQPEDAPCRGDRDPPQGIVNIQNVPGNVPDFGRMFLTLKYTDITQNTYIRS